MKNKKRLVSLILCVLMFSNCLNTVFAFEPFTLEGDLGPINPDAKIKYLKELSKINIDLANSVLVYEHTHFPVDPNEVLPKQDAFNLIVFGYVKDKDDLIVDSFRINRIRFSNDLSTVNEEKAKIYYCKSLETIDTAKSISMPDGYTLTISAVSENKANLSYDIITNRVFKENYDIYMVNRDFVGDPLIDQDLNFVIGPLDDIFIPKGYTLHGDGYVTDKKGIIVNPHTLPKGDGPIYEIMKYPYLLQSVLIQCNFPLSPNLILLDIAYMAMNR